MRKLLIVLVLLLPMAAQAQLLLLYQRPFSYWCEVSTQPLMVQHLDWDGCNVSCTLRAQPMSRSSPHGRDPWRPPPPICDGADAQRAFMIDIGFTHHPTTGASIPPVNCRARS